MRRLSITARGKVQGVGFRPYVWRLANELGLTGAIWNDADGVKIEIQGTSGSLREFERRLLAGLPVLAEITDQKSEYIAPLADEKGFQIKPSASQGNQGVLISPDVAICRQCIEDIRDPANRRFGYAFTNCTNCGPRFSITRNVPYDRKSTSMACFPLCNQCAIEYGNPADRRFHAQPVACAECGPHLWLVDSAAAATSDEDPLRQCARLLMEGKIVAIKGLGGFQLACDAANFAAVAELRKRKNRPHKALAIMAANIESVAMFCRLSPNSASYLDGSEKPIVLCPKRQDAPLALADNLAPDTGALGVMLPYTPMHILLFDALRQEGRDNPVLVMTSANARDEPICVGNREAAEKLDSLADAILYHNRDILCRVDDSVVNLIESVSKKPGGDLAGEIPVFIRRARGYVPNPIEMGRSSLPVLGAGAELKATFCLTRDNFAFPGQHIGDLKNPATFEFYQDALAHMEKLLDVRPQIIVRDLHPNYITSEFADKMGASNNLPVLALQHHAAHAAAVLGENGIHEPALVLCLDGAGLGNDGKIWGGELIWMDLSLPRWEKVGGLSDFPLPGGDAAARQPWRIAYAFCKMTGAPLQIPDIPARQIQAIDSMLVRNINCPSTSSCGRLFDAVAALSGICPEISYEGQAAIRLENHASRWLSSHCHDSVPSAEMEIITGETPKLDAPAFFQKLALLHSQNLPVSALAATFHLSLARGLADLCNLQAKKYGVTKVGLTGGVFQNSLMTKLLCENLLACGLEPLPHRSLPPGDGCISFGQAVWGNTFTA